VLVNLETGGDALLLAESLSVPDFVGVLKGTANGQVHTHGRVIDEVTDDQVKCYGINLDDFPEPSYDGRVLVLLSTP
jgi:hypothetical protein